MSKYLMERLFKQLLSALLLHQFQLILMIGFKAVWFCEKKINQLLTLCLNAPMIWKKFLSIFQKDVKLVIRMHYSTSFERIPFRCNWYFTWHKPWQTPVSQFLSIWKFSLHINDSTEVLNQWTCKLLRDHAFIT